MSKKNNKKDDKKNGSAQEPADADTTPGSENSGRKYGRREIRSNLDRYAGENSEDAGDSKRPSDFGELANGPSDCNFFQFKYEKYWETQSQCNSFSCHKFFDLDLQVLSLGLACLPFYERVGIEKELLSPAEIERCDKKSSDSCAQYKPMKDKFLKDLEKFYEIPGLVPESNEISVELNRDISQAAACPPFRANEVEAVRESLKESKLNDAKRNDKGDSDKNNSAVKTELETLEEWLDKFLSE